MKDDDPVRWTIDELRAAVAAALGEGYDGPPNARVRDVPDQRTIRYYTTLGLIDRALEMRGRTALYGTRHLLQLVAIKKLQAQGQSLAEVQQALVGQPTAAIARIAGLSAGRLKEKRAQERGSPRSFWKEAPAPVRKPEGNDIRRNGERSLEARAESALRPQQLQGIQLAANVTLLIAGSRTLNESELAALRLASSPMIDLLEKIEIIPPREEGDPR
jgi:DNA-binding transcriptional MerR regulator